LTARCHFHLAHLRSCSHRSPASVALPQTSTCLDKLYCLQKQNACLLDDRFEESIPVVDHLLPLPTHIRYLFLELHRVYCKNPQTESCTTSSQHGTVAFISATILKLTSSWAHRSGNCDVGTPFTSPIKDNRTGSQKAVILSQPPACDVSNVYSKLYSAQHGLLRSSFEAADTESGTSNNVAPRQTFMHWLCCLQSRCT
jgi:hypothetical protein